VLEKKKIIGWRKTRNQCPFVYDLTFESGVGLNNKSRSTGSPSEPRSDYSSLRRLLIYYRCIPTLGHSIPSEAIRLNVVFFSKDVFTNNDKMITLIHNR